MKKIFLLFVIVFSSIIVKAQGDYNFMPWGVGGGASLIRGYTNLAKQNNTLAFNINVTWYPSPYMPLTAELQKGRLWGGSRVTDPSRREYENDYTALLLHYDLQMGQVIDYFNSGFNDVMKNAYIGTGFGFVSDNVKTQRTNLIATDIYPIGSYTYPGQDHSVNVVIPLRIGYEFKFFNEYDEPYLRLDVEYEHNVVFGEGLDGYDDPPNHFKNQYPDQYRQISITFKYNFGRIRAFTKRIRSNTF